MKNTRLSKENVIKTKSSPYLYTAYWGYMTSAGTGDLVLIDNKVTSRMHIDILENRALSLLAANHTASVVEEFPQTERINWPPKLPDLNPIKNLWAHTIRNWPTNQNRRDMSRQHVQATWDNITKAIVVHLSTLCSKG